jgi:hypothetical protein
MSQQRVKPWQRDRQETGCLQCWEINRRWPLPGQWSAPWTCKRCGAPLPTAAPSATTAANPVPVADVQPRLL